MMRKAQNLSEATFRYMGDWQVTTVVRRVGFRQPSVRESTVAEPTASPCGWVPNA